MYASTRSKIDRYYQKLLRAKEREALAGKPLATEDRVEFCSKQLGFTPTAYQEKLLRDQNQFVVARWARQSGKSLTMAALTLHYALTHSGSRVAILAPSLRQSRKMIWRISSFLPKLGNVLEGKPLKTKLEFRNGSSIEALPNSPETIRGETLNLVFADELSFVQNDEELYDAVVYSLGTTNGRFIGTSTPGSQDSLFYSMCTDDERLGNVSRHPVSYREALEPDGPLKKEIVDQIRRQMTHDPWRWQREMEAEFAEDQDAWFPLELIKRCENPTLEPVIETAIQTGHVSPGVFFVGADLGQKHDHSAVAVVEKKGGDVHLVHLKRFKLGTEYGQVLGFLNLLDQKANSVRRILIDQTGVGEVFVEEAVKGGLKNAQGIMLSLPNKQDVMGYMKRAMEDGRLHIYYDRELIDELHVERFQLTKTGQVQFSHPDGTHDDRLWAFALAVYASRPEIPEYHPVAYTGRLNKPWWQASKVASVPKVGAAGVTNHPMCLTCWKPTDAPGGCGCKNRPLSS